MSPDDSMLVKQRSSALINIFLLVGSIILAFGLAEALLTLGEKIHANYQQVSNQAMIQKRSADINVKEKFKILCVGDSSTVGEGADTKHNYPYQLSKLLNRQSPKFEVAVISTGGTNSSQVANRFEKFLETDNYDLVILQIGINDIHKFKECNVPLYAKRGIYQWLMQSKVFNLIRMSLSLGMKKFAEDIDHRHPKRYGIGTELFLDQATLAGLYRQNFSKIVSVCKRKKVELWVQDYHTNGWLYPEKVLYKVYQEQGLNIVHQRKVFKDANGIQVRSADHWHPNSYGYFVIACIIYNKMIDEGILKGRNMIFTLILKSLDSI